MATPLVEFAEINASVDQDGAKHFVGSRTFWVTHQFALNLSRSIYGQILPNTSGAFAPHCWRTRIELGFFNKERAKLTALYRTRRDPSVVEVSIISKASSRTVTRDLDGKIIVGTYNDAANLATGHGLNFYKLVRGSNTIDEGQTIIVVKRSFERTGFNAQEIHRLMLLQGRVNDTRLPNFGDFPKGTLKLLRLPLTNRSDEGLLWYLDLAFAVSPIFPKTWNEWTQKQLHTKVRQQLPLYDTAGNVIEGSFTTSVIEIPKVFKKTALEGEALVTAQELGKSESTVALATNESVVEPTRLHREANFTEIDNLINWEF